MTDQESTSQSLNTSAPKVSAPFDVMQAIREGMASLISLVILVLAAVTLWYTFVSGGAAGSPTQVDAYNRQKDVMLYALALFGTVTGYYLGRVPAEINAKRADTAANAAQTQLVKTQEKLTDTAANASVAAAQLGQVKDEKTKIAKSLKETTGALVQAQNALTDFLAPTGEGRRTFAGAATPEEAGAEDKLRAARERIARVLARVEAED